MNLLFFILVTFFLVVVQTVLLPHFFFFPFSFDLLIIETLFLSLRFEGWAVIIAIAFIGMVMDSVSGVPFFFHLFAYLWVYIIVQISKRLVFRQSVVFIILISAVAMVIQQLFFTFCLYVRPESGGIAAPEISLMIYQVLFAAICVPPGIYLLSVMLRFWKGRVEAIRKYIAKHAEGEFD